MVKEVICGIHDLKPVLEDGFVELKALDGETITIDVSSDPDFADSTGLSEVLERIEQ